MNLKSFRSALLTLGTGVALTVGLAPAISTAQTAPRHLPAIHQAGQAPPAPPQSNRTDPHGFDRRANRFGDRLELDFLHSELSITPAQEPLWATFADAVQRESPRGRNQFFDRTDAFRRGPDGRNVRPSIIERLEQRQRGFEERSAHYERLLSALRQLYGMLSEDQRRAADEHLFSAGREDRFRCRPPRVVGHFGGNFYGAFDRPFGPYTPCYDHRLGRVYYP
jgi:LTXXQ motif family protein